VRLVPRCTRRPLAGPGRQAGARWPPEPRGRSGSRGPLGAAEQDDPLLTCGSKLHRVLTAGRSAALDYGSATRSASPALWSALVVRDGHCRHPGCDRPPPWCEGHHVVHFSKGGPTCLSNVVLLCRAHHRLYHAQGWGAPLPRTGLGGQARRGRHVCSCQPRGGSARKPPTAARGGGVEAAELGHSLRLRPRARR
jgi:hypothetical protein